MFGRLCRGSLLLAMAVLMLGGPTLGGCAYPQGGSSYGYGGNPYNPDRDYNPYDPESGGSSPYRMRSNW